MMAISTEYLSRVRREDGPGYGVCGRIFPTRCDAKIQKTVSGDLWLAWGELPGSRRAL